MGLIKLIISPTARATPISKELTIDDIRELTKDLKLVSDWHSLGMELGVKYNDLTNIEKNHSENDRRKTEMLACWILSCETPCTREAVAQALGQMGKHKVAKEIRKKPTTTIEGNCFQKTCH